MNYLQLAEIASNVYGHEPPLKMIVKIKGTENRKLGDGLYCCVYQNLITNEYALAIKGTSSYDDFKADLEYVRGVIIKEFNELMIYIDKLVNNFKYIKLSYITGHSLGGILAKMIVGVKPDLCKKVLAFNSPGVKAPSNCKVETVVAVGDEVGNFDKANESGKYIEVPIFAETKLERITEKVAPALTAASGCAVVGSVGGPFIAAPFAAACGIIVESLIIFNEHRMRNLLVAMSLDDKFKREF